MNILLAPTSLPSGAVPALDQRSRSSAVRGDDARDLHGARGGGALPSPATEQDRAGEESGSARFLAAD
jgi:hypothetical protein